MPFASFFCSICTSGSVWCGPLNDDSDLIFQVDWAVWVPNRWPHQLQVQNQVHLADWGLVSVISSPFLFLIKVYCAHTSLLHNPYLNTLQQPLQGCFLLCWVTRKGSEEHIPPCTLQTWQKWFCCNVLIVDYAASNTFLSIMSSPLFCSPNAVLRLRFNHFATECSWDHMYIYDGDSIYAPLVAVFRWVVF